MENETIKIIPLSSFMRPPPLKNLLSILNAFNLIQNEVNLRKCTSISRSIHAVESNFPLYAVPFSCILPRLLLQ